MSLTMQEKIAAFQKKLQEIRDSQSLKFSDMRPGHQQDMEVFVGKKEKPGRRWEDFLELKNKDASFKRVSTDLTTKSLFNYLVFIRHDFIFHGLYYSGSQMDMAAFSNNMLYEFEVKSSRDDFSNDFRKVYRRGKVCYNKHSQLAEGKALTNFFYFVVPEGMLAEDEVPDHAGLIVATSNPGALPTLQIVKMAPLLHRRRLNTSNMTTLAKKAFQKYCTLLLKHSDKIFNIENDVPSVDKSPDIC